MIISASYKTDIPTFYGDWFQKRLNAGFCRMVNPYNKNQHYRVSLRPQDVDGYVFWTKNVAPFFPVLQRIHRQRRPFVVQHTINGYPRALEARVVDPDKSVSLVQKLSREFGPEVAVWRYDTIVLSSLTSAEFHRANFARLARALHGAVNEVVVSFMHLYQKTMRNMDDSAAANAFSWYDPTDQEKGILLQDLVAIADSHDMTLSVCSQPDYLVDGAAEARCIDAERLYRVAGREFRAKLGGGRAECGCYAAKDIGDYDTCPHGCVYCYAVRNRAMAADRFRLHDPDGEYLFPVPPPDPNRQLSLLGET